MTLALSCRREWSARGRVSLALPCVLVSLPRQRCCSTVSRVHLLEGNKPQSIRVHEAAPPWASQSRGPSLKRNCAGISGSAAAEGPPLLCGWCSGWVWAREPSPPRAALRVPLSRLSWNA